MSNTTVTKGKLFVQEVIARLSGNNTEADAAKNARKAVSAIQGQLNVLAYKATEMEDILEQAEDKLNSCIYPVNGIESAESYLISIAQADERVRVAKQELADINDSIQFFTEILNTKILASDEQQAS